MRLILSKKEKPLEVTSKKKCLKNQRRKIEERKKEERKKEGRKKEERKKEGGYNS